MAEIWTVNNDVLPDGIQTWDAYLLGHDEYGTWLYTPTGTPIRDERGEQIGAHPSHAQLVANGRPWVASWFEDRSVATAVTSPAEITDQSIHYDDLGLHHLVDGKTGRGRDDTQAYEAALTSGQISRDRAEAIQATFSSLKEQIVDQIEPFGEIGPKWFIRITRNELHFVAYDPEWPAKFAAARNEIQPLLPSGSRVEHFGSTSVPGLAAKDCIDIAVAVPDLDQVQQVIPALESLGYEARPAAFDDPGHIFFRRLTDGRRSHHLHLYHQEHHNLIGVLAFRDFLRSNPQARDRYQAVKRSLAEANPFDRTGYAAGKDDVAQQLLQQALAQQSAPSEDSPTQH